ncbi:MAG TPA: M3 family oligoendopeptidase [Burkholderiaceae bacterium]|nr:M3 family oligoendopeptidase [Burkholderiaceae bacterium]
MGIDLRQACATLLFAAVGIASGARAAEGVAQWDLKDLYPTPQAWNEAFQRTRATVAALDRYKGTLGGSAEAMLAALISLSDARRETARLFVYASLRSDEDLRDASNVERRQQAGTLSTELAEKTAWLAPEVQAIGDARVRSFVAQSPVLRQRFDFFLTETLRAAPHTLGLEAESVLARTGDVLGQPYNVFSQLVDAEFPYPTIEIAGTKVRLTQSEYEKYRSVDDRATRKAVFDAFWATFMSYQGSLGSNLTTQVMGDVFSARARRFDTSLQHALFDDNMPEQVYRTLVAQANAGLPTLHRYLRLRKRLLGIQDELAYYDNYPPLFGTPAQARFTLADSQRITLEALAPMGDDYLAMLKRGFGASWSDPYPRPGKRSGAYVSGSAYDVHPYVLLNHNDDFESLTTYAHEWGHAVHTMLAQANQPYEKFGYSTFIAESASIANELLLSDYLVRTSKTREEKLFYLGQQLESIRTTFFRQVQFAEFQLQMHEVRERGEPLSGASLTESYCALLKRYYGESQGVMKIDPQYCVEWAYVPHFYFGYYVWQYATSMAGAAQFAEEIQSGKGTGARDRFVTMLKAGGSDFPYEIYRRAGVDLAQPAPYQALLRRMERVMDDIEALERAAK